jgi:hypothetical protein
MNPRKKVVAESRTSGCPDCDRLQQAALIASKAYHELLGDLEAAHIRRSSEALSGLSALLERALRIRDAAIAEWKCCNFEWPPEKGLTRD